MSNQQSSYLSYSSTSYTSSSSSDGKEPVTKSYTEQANYDSHHGGSIERTSQETGQPTLTERTEIPVQSQVAGATGAGGNNAARIEDVSGGQSDRDREYLERMEDEYAKREGGA